MGRASACVDLAELVLATFEHYLGALDKKASSITNRTTTSRPKTPIKSTADTISNSHVTSLPATVQKNVKRCVTLRTSWILTSCRYRVDVVSRLRSRCRSCVCVCVVVTRFGLPLTHSTGPQWSANSVTSGTAAAAIGWYTLNAAALSPCILERCRKKGSLYSGGSPCSRSLQLRLS